MEKTKEKETIEILETIKHIYDCLLKLEKEIIKRQIEIQALDSNIDSIYVFIAQLQVETKRDRIFNLIAFVAFLIIIFLQG